MRRAFLIFQVIERACEYTYLGIVVVGGGRVVRLGRETRKVEISRENLEATAVVVVRAPPIFALTLSSRRASPGQIRPSANPPAHTQPRPFGAPADWVGQLASHRILFILSWPAPSQPFLEPTNTHEHSNSTQPLSSRI